MYANEGICFQVQDSQTHTCDPPLSLQSILESVLVALVQITITEFRLQDVGTLNIDTI